MGIFIHTKIKILEKGTGLPLSGAAFSVKLFDKDPISDDLLGEASPDNAGDVEIKVDLDMIKSADTPFEEFPDLYFIVYKDGIHYFKSPLLDDIDTEKEAKFSFTEGRVLDLGTYLI